MASGDIAVATGGMTDGVVIRRGVVSVSGTVTQVRLKNASKFTDCEWLDTYTPHDGDMVWVVPSTEKVPVILGRCAQ